MFNLAYTTQSGLSLLFSLGFINIELTHNKWAKSYISSDDNLRIIVPERAETILMAGV